MKTQRKEALLYDSLKEDKVLCRLCPHYCEIEAGQRGICQVRENQAGELYSLVYGRTIVEHVDPVEKKPLFHFHPGSLTYSIATGGCNFRCAFCTNWQVSQMSSEEFNDVGSPALPAEIVARAVAANCSSIAYTYTEPTIFFEYMTETAQLARAAGLSNIIKTNGFFSKEALSIIGKLLDAANVDLKAFSNQTYQKMGGRLTPVLDTLYNLKALGVWVEVTTVIIPGINDGIAELEEIIKFILTELGDETPWHVMRFFPEYRMQQVSPTPVKTLIRAQEIGRSLGLQHIYIGNLIGSGLQDTACKNCGTALILRQGGKFIENSLLDDRCASCGAVIQGTW